MSDQSEILHQHQDLPESIDRLDHFLSELRALVDKYSDKPEINLAVCEICSLEKAGRVKEKF